MESTMKIHNKLLLATVISSALAAPAFADESTTNDASAEKDGFRFSVPVGPYYDPIFQGALAIVPTFAYEMSDSADAKTSYTKLMTIGSHDGNYAFRVFSDNYWGDTNQWKFRTVTTYSHAKTDADNFMRDIRDSLPAGVTMPGVKEGSLSEIEQDALRSISSFGYQLFDDFYIGPSIKYVKTSMGRDDGGANSTTNVVPEEEEISYGIEFEWDKRDNINAPSEGFMVRFDAKKRNIEKINGSIPFMVIPGVGNVPLDAANQNGEVNFMAYFLDLRGYYSLSESTVLASRLGVEYNEQEAGKRITNLGNNFFEGFTAEVAARSVVVLDTQIRHMLTKKIGMVTGISLGRGIDAMTDKKEDLYYAATAGIRYVIDPKDKLSARLDFTYNNQEEDNVQAYFSVSERF